jgi:hypothetical protein
VVSRFFSPGKFGDRRDYYGGEMASDFATEPTIGEQLPRAADVDFRQLPNGDGPAVWHVAISAGGQHADWYAYLEDGGGKPLLSAVRTLAVSEALSGEPGLRLAASSDASIRSFGTAHLDDLRTVAGALRGHPAERTIEPSSGDPAGRALSRLHLPEARLDRGRGDDVFIDIGGITDNVTGFVNVPAGGEVPVMDGDEFIYLERFAPRWYVFKTT